MASHSSSLAWEIPWTEDPGVCVYTPHTHTHTYTHTHTHTHMCVCVCVYKSICTWGFPGGLAAKNPPVNAGDTRDRNSIPGSEGSPGVANGNLLQYLCLENTMDRRVW